MKRKTDNKILSVPCPRCNEPIEGQASLKGQTVSCPACKKIFVVTVRKE